MKTECISCGLGQMYSATDLTGEVILKNDNNKVVYTLGDAIDDCIHTTASIRYKEDGSITHYFRFLRRNDSPYDVAPYIKTIEKLGFIVKKLTHKHDE